MIEQLFSNFSIRTLFTPELIVILAIVAWLYFMIIGRWRHRIQGSEPVGVKKKAFFLVGLFFLYLGWGSPLYTAGHLMFSFHMLQMVFAYLAAAPFLILGIPRWLFEAMIERFKGKRVLNRTAKILFNPLVGLLFFNGLFSFYHIPVVFDFLMPRLILHDLYQVMMLIGAFLMWWQMLAPLPQTAQLSHLRRIGFVFASGFLILPACALIIFAPTAVYDVYTDPMVWAQTMTYCFPAGMDVPYGLFTGPESFSPLTPRLDQQLAGVLMKILQEVSYGMVIGAAFRQWVKREKQSDGPSISDIPVTPNLVK